MAVYPSRIAPIGLKLCENAFQAIPDISFFDVENLFETSNGRLPLEDGSVRPQTSGKRVSGDPQHLIFRRQKKKKTTNFFVGKNFLKSKNASFGRAVKVWTSLADAPRKFIARHMGFSLLRPLAEG